MRAMDGAREGAWPADQVERWPIARLIRFRDQLRVLLLESVGNIFEKDQAEDDMLVFGCVHTTAQRVGHLPKLGFVPHVGAVPVSAAGGLSFPRSAPRRASGTRRHPPKATRYSATTRRA